MLSAGYASRVLARESTRFAVNGCTEVVCSTKELLRIHLHVSAIQFPVPAQGCSLNLLFVQQQIERSDDHFRPLA